VTHTPDYCQKGMTFHLLRKIKATSEGWCISRRCYLAVIWLICLQNHIMYVQKIILLCTSQLFFSKGQRGKFFPRQFLLEDSWYWGLVKRAFQLLFYKTCSESSQWNIVDVLTLTMGWKDSLIEFLYKRAHYNVIAYIFSSFTMLVFTFVVESKCIDMI